MIGVKPRFVRCALLSLIFLMPVACKRSAPPPPPRAGGIVAVQMAEVQVRPVERFIDVVGTLHADEEVVISNKVSGRLIALHKDVQDIVEAGEPLAQLLRNDYEQDVRQKEAELGEVLAKLGLTAAPAGDFDVETLPAVRRGKFEAENAQSRYKRGKELSEQVPPLITDQDFADLKTARDVALASYDAERLTARGLLAQVRTRQAELAIAQQALSDTTVRAPRAEKVLTDHSTQPPTTRPAMRRYRVSARMPSEGQLLAAITPMFKLIDVDTVKFRAAVPEARLSQLALGAKVEVKIDAYDRVFAGHLARINPQIDPATRTVQIEAVLQNPDLALSPGAFARGKVFTGKDVGAVFVPRQALVTFAGVSKVFLVKDSKAVERVVETGLREGDSVEITKGLKPGERVVAAGAAQLANGMAVVTTAPASKPATRATGR